MRDDDPHFPGWRIATACAVGTFFATVPLNAFSVFLRPLTDQFGWSRAQASSAYGTLTLTAALSAPFVGIAIDRIGARRVVIPGLLVSAAALASLAAGHGNLWLFRVTFAILGLTTMASSPIAYSRVVFGWFDQHRGRALAVMLSGAALSSIVTPLAAQWLIRQVGWRTAWLAIGLTTAAVAVPVAARFIHERHGHPATHAGNAGSADIFQALRSRLFWTLAVVTLFGTVATNAAIVHLVALLVDRGVSPSLAPLALSTMGAASLLGRLTSGWLLDRFPAPRVSVLLLTIAASGTWLLAIAPSLKIGVLAAACIGFGSGGEVDVIPFLLSRYFGLGALSTLYGLHWTAWGIAGALGPTLMGRTFDITGSYTIVLCILGAVTLIAALLMLTLPTPKRH